MNITVCVREEGVHNVFFFRLWGENFFNPKTKKWAKQKEEDNKRSFNMYVLDPIYKVV